MKNMTENRHFDFWYALNNTEVLLAPTSTLDTFGTTILNYHLVTELLDTAQKIRVREGRVQAYRPEIITPKSFSESMLEGFGEEAHHYADWLRENEQDLMILRYGFAVRKEHHGEEILTGDLRDVADRVKDTVAKAEDPLAAVLVGVEEPWEVCLLKLLVDVARNSAASNVHSLQRLGITSEEDRQKAAMRQELETDFASAAIDRRQLDSLSQKLKRFGVFEEYEDRFFALVRSHGSAP